MARDTDDDAPWLAEGVSEPRSVTLVPRGRLFGGVAIFALLAALVAVGLYVIVSGKKSSGSNIGVVRAEDAPLIAADPGPYKTQPTNPGGLTVEGTDQTIYSAGTGGDPNGTIDPSKAPEEPLARQTGVPAVGAPKELLPAAVAPVAPAPAPVPVKVAVLPKPVAKPVAEVEAPKAAPKAAAIPKPVVAEVKPVAPTALKSANGTAAVQLGAFSTEAKAEAAWVRVSARHAELAGFQHRVTPLDRDGATLFRLRASGSGSPSAVCAALTAAGDACLVAK